MNPQDPYQAAPEVKVNNPLSSMQAGEQNICQIKRHPFGIITTYISAGVLLAVIALIAFVVAPLVFSNTDRGQLDLYGALALLVMGILILGFVFVASKVYWGNRWILTTDSLTQVLQRSLFDKQSSQLSLGNLEDVTVQQDGILAHMFNFGVLRAETAGERSKFVFLFCPNPNSYAQQILHAREAFEQGRRPAPYGNQDLNNAAAPMNQPQTTQTPAAGYDVPLGPEDDNSANINTGQ